MQNFVETNCTVVIDGKACTAGGAARVGDNIRAYLCEGGTLSDWHGNKLGTYRITGTWKTPRSFVSDTMHQVVALVDGVYYIGRSAGVCMAFVGKKKAKQSW
jgi:hypothetical protein